MSTPSGCESLYAVSVPMSAGPWCSFSKSLRVQWPLQWQPTTWGSTSATTHGARGENGNFTYLVSMLSDCALEQHSCLRIFCCRFESPSAVTQLDALAYVCMYYKQTACVVGSNHPTTGSSNVFLGVCVCMFALLDTRTLHGTSTIKCARD